MTYDVLGPGPLDYLPCRYGASKLLFRGPKRDLDQPYVAFIGATETYGKFIGKPFPALLEAALGTACVNFGQINAGIDAFAHDPFVIEAASGARVTVIQVLGAQNMSNRFYSVHPRRNDRFLGATPLLREMFREVDFADYHFNKHMLGALLRVSPERFETVRQALQQTWCARMRLLLGQIEGPKVLLWFSARRPERERRKGRGLGLDPLFVTRAMLEEVSPLAHQVVEVAASPRARAAGRDGMIFAEMDAPAAAQLLGPVAHEEAARALCPVIRPLL